MKKILGLDLGTNSIGWALIEDNTILGMGSRIFPEGVVNLGEGEGEGRETSKNASRTEARGVRRQFYRRRLRKRYLLKELAKYKLCPISDTLIKDWNGTEIFKNKELQKWFKLNPYELRAKAISEKITLLELGRIFYHFIQRRGFLSNSRSAGADVKEASTIFKGDAKIGKIGISETLNSIDKNKTLGSYLSTIYPKENEPFSGELERIRNRYTTRQMYIDEFETIWEFQQQYHKELTITLKTILGGRKKDGYKEDGVLFHQRPLRSQKHLVGYCTFEPKKTKCPISAIPFELFRIYQWLNTLSYDVNGIKQKITSEEREKIVTLLLSKEKPNFKEIRKVINKLDGCYQFNYKDDDKIVGSHTISNLSNKKFFGKEWFDFSDEEQENIWHVLSFFDDRDKLKEYAIKNWGFDEEKATKISKFNLKEGYSNLSRKAINNILPFLKEGFMYDVAVGLAGVKNVLGKDWEEHKQFVLDNVPEIVRSNLKGGYIEPLKNMMKNEFNCTDKQLEKLYHHSSAIETVTILDKLPVNIHADREIQKIKNPVVITALFEIRKLVNEIIDTYGKPDEIKVELARDLKASKKNRYETRRKQQTLEKENDRVKGELEKLGQRINHTNILKYKLWEECNHTCPFTGKTITISQLFTGEIQIEHIFPWSRSLNDSFNNKTLCFADENRAKGNYTPYEFYSKHGDKKWEAIKLQALNCFKDKYPSYPNAYRKFKHFVKQKHDEDFISRQLNDTRYISKEAKNYLSKICNNVMVAPGQMTAVLRHQWGLNSILNKDDDTKTRDDHRHHAIDALVMACATRSHLQELSKRNRYNKNYELKDFPEPWFNFRNDAEKAIAQILVSHKKQKSLLTVRTHITKKNGVVHKNLGIAARGQLHKESVYGLRQAPNSTQAFHVRKPLESLTTEKHLEKIVDKSIRELIYKKVQQLGGFIKGKIPKETFFIIDENGEKQPQIFLPNRNGKPVPIKKVRIKENIGGAEKLKEHTNQYVNPRNNHHVLIYKDFNDNLKEEVVTFWTAIERKRQKQAVFQLPKDGKEIISTLQINDLFLLGVDENEIDWEKPDNNLLNRYLYRVQKISSKDYNFRKVEASTILNKIEAIRIKSIPSFQNLKPIKVKLNSIGKIVKL
ncbi:type II CRISPR RNA-guided endonuclease Cas9 [Polaribacter sp. MSW13]|uniref:CRISPR-associated endonuclease Cas9 n=1 Tax=Polaribacter marinus TaxID=2916838 RepID=A0A9X2AM29_9FLAO|nr:type II CRISPR RNA-guided endonuclease Cas9 [Polaribacter marinus]MCI2228509.1 type II CRISPR RNA-guided endonuclease Cas9 [Polaribacter marinus]